MFNGPIYAHYNNLYNDGDDFVGHVVVVTGVVAAPGHPGLVITNNSWGFVNIQSFDEFTKGIPKDESKPPMRLIRVRTRV